YEATLECILTPVLDVTLNVEVRIGSSIPTLVRPHGSRGGELLSAARTPGRCQRVAAFRRLIAPHHERSARSRLLRCRTVSDETNPSRLWARASVRLFSDTLTRQQMSDRLAIESDP